MNNVIGADPLPRVGHYTRIILLFSWLVLALGLSSIAGAANIPEQISFQNIMENKDIVMGEGAVFLQDSEGFMWLGGSSALIRYDGYEFRQIDLIETGKTPQIKTAVKAVQHLIEDNRHTIWIASRTGVLQFDSRKGKLSKLPDDDSQSIKLSTSDVKRLAELPSGEIIACSIAGLFVIDPKTLKYTVIVPDANKENWLRSKRVNTALVNKDGSIWLGTEEGLERVDWKTKTFTLFKLDRENPDSVPDNRVAEIAVDEDGTFWLATTHGLVHFDPHTQNSTRYVNKPGDKYSLGGNDLWKVMIDKDGVLWITSDGGGLSVFDRDNNRFINYQHQAGRVGSLNTNQVRTVYQDKDGDIWVGNYPVGVNFFDRSSSPISSYANDPSNPKSLNHNAVQSVMEDEKGNLWLGTDGGGLNYFDRTTGEFSAYKSLPDDPETINGNAIIAHFKDSTGTMWVGVWGGGLASFKSSDMKFTRYPFDQQRKSTKSISTSNKLNSAHVRSIYEDSHHTLWITTHTGGLSKLDRETKIFTHYTHIVDDPTSIADDLAWNSIEDSRGNFWVGTASGVCLMDRDKGTFTTFTTDPKDPKTLSNPSVISIFEDSKKRLWLGTDAGLNLLDPDSKTFTVYDKKSGFIDDTIREILEDASGTLWLSTNNGFASFNPETKKIKNYNRISGRLIGGFSTNAGAVSREGEIIFGGVSGLRIFKPDQLTENKNIPAVVLTDFKVFSDSVVVDAPDGILSKSINFTDTLQLDYKKSMFTFSFAALNFRDTEKNRYAYKLEGFDENWLDAGDQRVAKYTNLDPGKYVFRVKGSNNDGVWNETGKSITIIQLTPPWKTWWAYTIYGLALASLLAWILYQQRRKRQLVEEQNRLLEIKVAERTAEVREKSEDIQAMLSNIPQGLFTVQDGGVIHPAYSNFLESIFETKEIAGHNVSEFLFSRAKVGSDTLASVNAAIFSIIGEDEMNFSFNRPLLIDEFDIQLGAEKKNLSLDWNPIVTNDTVSKLMVSVRDVTRLKQMEAAAIEQKRQLDIVSQLLNLSAEKYLSFEASSEKYLKLNREAITHNKSWSDSVCALLFRNMHTIKGNCRTYGFNYLSNIVHEAESVYSALKNSNGADWNADRLLSDLDKVEASLAEYSHVYREVLGRADGTGNSRRDGFWMSNSVMLKIRTYLQARKLEELDNYVAKINAVTLEQNLADVIASLSSIARQLDKKPPQVSIKASNIFLREKAQSVLVDVFTHVLRNSIDHGIETPESRASLGKNEVGTVEIVAAIQHGKLNLAVQDDGAGLNIPGLFQKGIALGIWKADAQPSAVEIANIIFHSGVSIKDEVTEISGRGVGMDVVQKFLREVGADVALKLHPEQPSVQGRIPFELIITLPSELFIFSDGGV